MKRRLPKKTNWRVQYDTFFRTSIDLRGVEERSLEQPSPLRIVPSKATSGAYEEPVQIEET